jgi:hypothetical protein
VEDLNSVQKLDDWKTERYEQLLPPGQIVIWRSTYCCLQVTRHHHTSIFLLLASFPYYEKIKAGLWDWVSVCISFLIFVFIICGPCHPFPELLVFYSGKSCNSVQDLLDTRPLGWPRNCFNTTLGCLLPHSGAHTWMLGWLMDGQCWSEMCTWSLEQTVCVHQQQKRPSANQA